MKLWNLLIILLALAVAPSMGCGDDPIDDDFTPDGGDGDADGDTDGDADSDTDGDTDTTDGGTDDDGGPIDNDESTSCADAVELILNDGIGLSHELQSGDDIDYFLVTIDADDTWLTFWTEGYVNKSDGHLDTVIEVYNEAGDTLIATADDAVPWVGTDSELIYKAKAGTYCVAILEWDEWAGKVSPSTKSDYTYTVKAGTVQADGNGTFDTGSNDTLADAQDIKFIIPGETTSSVAWLFGEMSTSDASDYYGFTLQVGNKATSIDVRPAGTGSSTVQGHGSTLELNRVELIRVSDDAILARMDPTKPQTSIQVPLDEGDKVACKFTTPAGFANGDNDFYTAIIINSSEYNPLEAETEAGGTNDTFASAETLSFTDNSAYLGAKISPVGDADWWTFDAVTDLLSINCSSATSGSGVESFTVKIYSDDGTTELETWIETSDESIYVKDIAVTAGNTYYLEMSATGQSSDVISNNYTCGIHG